jgi:Uncharacterized protein conserved in bacteria (DUF2325)
MRIGWIGGLTRNESQISRMAEWAGHSLEFHSGDMSGSGADQLRRLVERVDFVVLVTEINSHGAVILTKKLCHRLGRGSLVMRSCGTSRFQALLDALAIRNERTLAAAS